MESERFQRVERLFHEAMARPADSRLAYIDQACDGDIEVASRVKRMIEYAGRAAPTAGLIAGCDNGDPAQAERDEEDARLVGAIMGSYRILERLGEGGFGAVYQAEQLHPIHRTVALKLLRSGMDSRRVIARFDAERQTLAMMEHPGIARVFDAGQTDPTLGSRPYFVMELVSGEPISAYCDRHRLDARRRLELFITVCSAVHHAHQKGVIHRDLKPSNILVAEVDSVAGPKIIDFGIAKAIHQSPGRMVTQRLELLGTPQYMSPEQADPDGSGIDTRSDIYSLGVVLYELLTGTTPLDGSTLSNVSQSRMQQMIRDQAIERPSSRLTSMGDKAIAVAQKQDTDVAALRRRLRGDLDWITVKALEHERERRYSSAAALAEDIRRHLNHEPVLAGPPTAVYRTRKFIRRHRIGVIAASLVGLAIVGGVIGVTLAMMRAREAADQASQVSLFLSDVLTSASPDRQGTEVRLAEVLENASSEVSQRFAAHPDLEADVRETLGYAFGKLTMPQQGATEYRRAYELRREVHGPDAITTLNSMHYYVRALINEGNGPEAERMMAEALPRVQRQKDAMPFLWNEALILQAGVHRIRGRFDEAEQVLRQLRENLDRSPQGDAVQIPVSDNLIRVLRAQLSGDPVRDRDRQLEIVSLSTELAERCARHVGPDAESTLHARTMLAEARSRLGETREARAILEEVIPLIKARVGDCHRLYLDAIDAFANVRNRLGETSAAVDLVLQEVNCIREREGRSIVLLATLSEAMPFLDRGERWAEGEALAREYADGLRSFGGGHRDTQFVADLYVARFTCLQGRLDEAGTLFEALESRRSEMGDDASLVARFHLMQARLLVNQGHYDRAEQRLREASALVGDVRDGTSGVFPDDIITEFIVLYQASNKPEKLAEYQRLREESVRRHAGEE